MRAFSLLVVLLALAGCQSSTVTVDYDTEADFSATKRYTWAEKTSGVEEGFDPLLAQRVKSAVERNLAAASLTPAVEAQKPDVLVRYYVASHTEEQESRSRGSIGFGSGGGNVGVGIGLSFPLGGSKVVKQAQIIVDMLNPESGKLVWRGTNRLKIGDDSPEKITTKVNQAIADIFKKFPPEKSDD